MLQTGLNADTFLLGYRVDAKYLVDFLELTDIPEFWCNVFHHIQCTSISHSSYSGNFFKQE